MKKIRLSKFKNLINLQKTILSHFQQITGIKDTQNLTIEIVYSSEEYQSDCDGDDNYVRVKIVHEIGGLGMSQETPIDIVNIHKKIYGSFCHVPIILQEIANSPDYPHLKTIFTFSYYNFTKK